MSHTTSRFRRAAAYPAPSKTYTGNGLPRHKALKESRTVRPKRQDVSLDESNHLLKNCQIFEKLHNTNYRRGFSAISTGRNPRQPHVLPLSRITYHSRSISSSPRTGVNLAHMQSPTRSTHKPQHASTPQKSHEQSCRASKSNQTILTPRPSKTQQATQPQDTLPPNAKPPPYANSQATRPQCRIHDPTSL